MVCPCLSWYQKRRYDLYSALVHSQRDGTLDDILNVFRVIEDFELFQWQERFCGGRTRGGSADVNSRINATVS